MIVFIALCRHRGDVDDGLTCGDLGRDDATNVADPIVLLVCFVIGDFVPQAQDLVDRLAREEFIHRGESTVTLLLRVFGSIELLVFRVIGEDLLIEVTSFSTLFSGLIETYSSIAQD